jgi:glutaminase
MKQTLPIPLPTLQAWVTQARSKTGQGKLPQYIPKLAQVNPQQVAIAICTNNLDSAPHCQTAGDITCNFPLMSVVKPLLLLYLLETIGADHVFQLVDRQPSSQPFNYIPQSKPHNPMLNCGAIALASLLDSSTSLQTWLQQKSGIHLHLDTDILTSVRSMRDRQNIAIAQQLQNLDILPHPSTALATYEEICCLRTNVTGLAQLGLLLTTPSPHCDQVLEIMTQCGMYAESSDFAQQIGLPSKSSISGALLSIAPHQTAIACYSPTLNAIGNSVAGLFLLHKILGHLRHHP